MLANDPFAPLLAVLASALPYAPVVGLAGAAVTAGWFGPARVTSGRGWAARIFTTFGLLWLGGAVVYAGAIVVLLWAGVSPAVFAFALTPQAGLATVALGLALVAIKGRWLFVYGVIEVICALTVLFAKAVHPEDDVMLRFASLVVAMYFLVRGVENMTLGAPEAWRSRLRPWFRLFAPKLDPERPRAPPR
ncbi:hypothetical protein PMI01_03837 [Caulobacter sp. AP07]|uniref:hypothetical protein n=1 Tax=Caulobacter sp. AP07 TaxID=1144304 RepID=UPI0002720C6F|nr:hypothetical protein [Caulobacter sp. AP07]EJL27356.1 hypothetical protein PMI01_03837 [Caulobacter sp. AP07]